MNNETHRELLTVILTICILTASNALGQAISRIQERDKQSSKTLPAAKTVGCNDGWDTTFTTNGTNGRVNTIVSDGLGNTYIGGYFTSVQGTPAAGIAKWNGTTWSALGSGVTGEVKSIAIMGNDIYVGGGFGTAGGSLAKNVAKWNGTTWSPLGAGLGGGTHEVEAVVILGSDVYIGGNFNIPDGSPADGIVRWDGTSYSSVGNLLGQVQTLAVKDGELYAGGNIALTLGVGVGLAKWNGTTWSTFGLSGNSTVNSIGFNGTNMYLGGSITTPGGSGHIVKWNGAIWTSLGSFSNSPIIETIAFLGSDVYVGGTFERSGGVGIGNGIIKYNGSQWSALGTGTELGNHRVNSILVTGNTLLIGGDFQLAGGIGAKNIAKLTDGTTWSAAFPGTGIDAPAKAIAVSGSDVYVGGTFITAGSSTANSIAKWNGATNMWSSLSTGAPGSGVSVNAIAIAGNKVYIGGLIGLVDGVNANNIAVWNGTSWSTLGTGLNGSVTSIIARGEDIYVGGAFTTAGGVPANRVAKWNGTSWSGLNSSILPTTVTGMAFMGDDLYVGTGTTTIANPAYFTKYDGTTWTALGADLGDRGVSSVAVSGTDVYVAGGFTSINGNTVNRIAKWNGTSWSGLGNGLPSLTGQPGSIRLAASGTDLLATGDFTLAGGGPANGIARWNGSAWSELGTGLDTSGSVVTSAGGDIFAGGGFNTAGCNQSPYFARYRQTLWTGSTNSDWHTSTNWGGDSIPPANGGVSVSSNDVAITSANVTLGSLVVTSGRTLTIGVGRTLTINGNLDVSNGTIAGPGTLIVNGDASANNATISGLASLTLSGNLYLTNATIIGDGTVAVSSCRTSAIVGGDATSYISSPLSRCVNSQGTYRFPVGSGGVYSPVELSSVSGSGTLTIEPRSGPYSGAAAGLPGNRLQRWWSFTNIGLGQANLAFTYSDPEVVGIEGRYRAYSIDGGTAQLVPTVLNLASNRATVGSATSFSAWTLAEGPPTFETLKGRITTPRNRGADRVIVSLTDQAGNVRYALTNNFGYYRFTNVETWKTYTVRLQSKKYSFAQTQRVLEFIESAPDVNFVSTDH